MHQQDIKMFEIAVIEANAINVYPNILESHVCNAEKCVCLKYNSDKTVFCLKNQRCLNTKCLADNAIVDENGVIVKNKFSTFVVEEANKTRIQVVCQKGQYWKCESANKCACFNKIPHRISPNQICKNKNDGLNCLCVLFDISIQVSAGHECKKDANNNLSTEEKHTFLECRYKFECPSDATWVLNKPIQYYDLKTLKFIENKPADDTKILKREENIQALNKI